MHEIRGGSWQTRAEFGLPARGIADVAAGAAAAGAASAAGWLPGVAGLQIGAVARLEGDPAGAQRIQINIPVLRAQTNGIWARLLQSHASKGFGAVHVPDVGDEVVVGYFNDDPSNPVVLGSLYSSNRAPPYPLAAQNDIKALVTRSKARIEINDADVIVTIQTPAENQIVINDKDKSILLSDQHGNSISMDAAGITIGSANDIVMTAKGKITADADMAIALTATADLVASGLNVTAQAQVAIACTGNASAELSASGQTIVRGAMVMIN